MDATEKKVAIGAGLALAAMVAYDLWHRKPKAPPHPTSQGTYASKGWLTDYVAYQGGADGESVSLRGLTATNQGKLGIYADRNGANPIVAQPRTN